MNSHHGSQEPLAMRPLHKQLAVDAAGLGTWELNPVTGERHMSARCRELAGMTDDEDFTGERFALVHPGDREQLKAAMARALDPESGGEYRVEYRTVHPVERWIAATGKCFFEDGRAVRLIGTVQDITDRKNAEREREVFLGVLGHDLRGPLTTIMINSVLLKRRSPASEPCERITASAMRMSRMVDELIDFARSRTGELQIRRTPCDLVDVCRDVLYEVTLPHPHRAVEFSQFGDTRGEWDSDRIAQVVQNLVSNAIAYGAPGTPIDVTIGGLGDTVRIAVSNRGAPIPQENRAHLFDPFRRAAEAGKGAGRALYIAQQIVRAHGGVLDFTSDELATVFRVELPRR